MSVENVTPYGTNESKRVQITHAFDLLARRYDQLNRILSLGMDLYWRKRALHNIKINKCARILDVATGTADFAILAAQVMPWAHITGIDISQGMLEIGRNKVARKKLNDRVLLETGDALSLNYSNTTFDAVIVAFGVRNFENIQTSFREFQRMLRPGGHVVILELSEPQRFPMRQLCHFYLRHMIPLVGRVLTGYAREYQYLPDSIQQVPQGDDMLVLLRTAGFSGCHVETYTFGVCSCYTATAPLNAY